jgi:adenosylhomocysteine nucleosidase
MGTWRRFEYPEGSRRAGFLRDPVLSQRNPSRALHESSRVRAMWQSLLRNYLLRAAADHVRSQHEAQSGTDSGPAPSGAEPAEPTICHVGLVFALAIEAGGLVDQMSGVVHINGAGFVAREGGLGGRRLVLLECGVGREAAARGTHALLTGHRPRWVISAGFAGGLHPALKQGDILMANEIADLAGRRLAIDFKISPEALARTPGLHVGRLLTVDSVVSEPADKRALGESHGALAVDMESSAVAEVCRDQRVKFLSVRVISDAVDHELPRDIDHLVRQKSTLGRIGAVTGAIVRRPSSVKDMWQLKEAAIGASDRLAKFLAGIVPQLE